MCRACQTSPGYPESATLRHYLKDIKRACRVGMAKGLPKWLATPNRNEDINRLLRSNDPHHFRAITSDESERE